jgi:hypothetical protein
MSQTADRHLDQRASQRDRDLPRSRSQQPLTRQGPQCISEQGSSSLGQARLVEDPKHFIAELPPEPSRMQSQDTLI